MAVNKMIVVEVAYAKVTEQIILNVSIKEGSTIEEIIYQSGILTLFPEIDLNQQKVGIFSKVHELSFPVHRNCRIEIYRQLLIDPKEARRFKAKSFQKISSK